MINWEESQPGTPENHIFIVCRACIAMMATQGQSFTAEAAAFIMATSPEAFTTEQKVAIGTVGANLPMSNTYELAAALNAVLFGTWDSLGIKNMPEGSGLTTEQRLGFIQGIYGYAATRIAQHLEEIQSLLSVPYRSPQIPVLESE